MWKRFILGILFLFCSMLLVLAVHVYTVTKPNRGQIPSLTLTRVDFPRGLEPLVSEKVQERVMTWEGIRDVRINSVQGHVVFLHDLSVVDSDELVSKLNFHFNQGAVVYRPDAAMVSQSCPAIDKQSLTYRFVSFIEKSLK